MKEKTSCFDAAIEGISFPSPAPVSARFFFGSEETGGRLELYAPEVPKAPGKALVRVTLDRPFFLRWRDAFTVETRGGGKAKGEGIVLVPDSEKVPSGKRQKKLHFLQELLGGEKEMLAAVVRLKGYRGLEERELMRFCRLSREALQTLSRELEAEGRLFILRFSPLFLLSREGFSFLSDRIQAYLQRYHRDHPDDPGIPRAEIQKRFTVPSLVLALALKALIREGGIREEDGLVSLASFTLSVSPEEERILDKLERMTLEGRFHSASMEELQRTFRLSSKRLQKLLHLLVERKKIVWGKDGFLLHSRWLDEVIRKIRGSGKKELTVAEFKTMTGLSRKYAIPLLELLDQMRVTRRRGSKREILD